MKKLYLIVLNITFINLYSQIGHIEYGYIEAFGIGNAQGPEYNAILTFDEKTSYYVVAKDSLETIEKINSQQTFNNSEGNVAGAIYNGLKSSKEGDQVFYNSMNKTMFSTFYYDKLDYINDGVIKFKWIISKETKKIGNFNCIKATTTFRGRDFTAWFTSEVSVPYGPWKLNGLPGLIIEAYDKGKFVLWSLKNIEYPSLKLNVKKIEILSNYKPYNQFKDFQKEELKKEEERSLIFSKQYPNVEISKPKLSEMFIECE